MKKMILVVLGLIICALGTAQADIILSTLSSSSHATNIAEVTSSTDTAYVGNRFTAGSDMNIQLVTIGFGNNDNPVGNFELRLYSNVNSVSNAPQTLLTTFSGSSNPTANTDEEYTLDTPFPAEEGTSYWLVAVVTEGLAEYGWKYTSDPTTTASEGWQVNEAAFISSNDLSINAEDRYLGSPQLFSIDSIPEPATVGLIGSFGFALLFVNRKILFKKG